MPILRSAPPSPFGRKVKIAAAILGLKGSITIENTDTASPDDSIRQQNPLGKIPALVLDDGTTLFDSRVILEYLDHLAGGNKIIPAGEARFAALRNQALADGLMDAAILQVYEKRFRPAQYRFADWSNYQAEKVKRVLAAWEAARPAPVNSGDDLDVGTITIACALGYLDLRFGGDWRADHPKLSAWIDAVEDAVPAFADTKLPPAPVPDEAAPLR